MLLGAGCQSPIKEAENNANYAISKAETASRKVSDLENRINNLESELYDAQSVAEDAQNTVDDLKSELTDFQDCLRSASQYGDPVMGEDLYRCANNMSI